MKSWTLGRIGLYAALAFASVAMAVGQDTESASPGQEFVPGTETIPAPADVSAYSPLTPAEKYLYSVNRVFTGPVWIGFAVHAAVDQFRDAPHQWGSNAESFGMRMASHFGTSLLRETVAFGIRAADHEDPRYFRSGQGSGWSRTRYALQRTFMVRNDRGSMMPAYSSVIAAYATPFLVHEWRPERFTRGDDLLGGSIQVGIGAATNVWQEFWPDVRKKMPAFVAKHLNP